jgi:hypothetical protein
MILLPVDWDSVGVRTDCKLRANNAILRGWWGNPWGFESLFGTVIDWLP